MNAQTLNMNFNQKAECSYNAFNKNEKFLTIEV